MQWHYAINGETRGPVSEAEFARLVEREVIGGETLVWHQGMAEWQTLVTVLGDLPLALPPRSAGAAVSDPRPVPGPFGYGGFWPRVAARLIDAAFVAFLGGLAHWLIGSMIGGLFTSLPYVDLMIPEINGLVDMVLFVVYAEIFVHWFDATPGKMALGLKILRSDGEKLGRGRSLAREWLVGVSFALLGIGALMVAFDPERRSLHDRICDTRVIRSR